MVVGLLAIDSYGQSPACLWLDANGKCTSTPPKDSIVPPKTESPAEKSSISLENDADCPLPDCHYEMYQGARQARWEIKLKRKSSTKQTETENTDEVSQETEEAQTSADSTEEQGAKERAKAYEEQKRKATQNNTIPRSSSTKVERRPGESEEDFRARERAAAYEEQKRNKKKTN